MHNVKDITKYFKVNVFHCTTIYRRVWKGQRKVKFSFTYRVFQKKRYTFFQSGLQALFGEGALNVILQNRCEWPGYVMETQNFILDTHHNMNSGERKHQYWRTLTGVISCLPDFMMSLNGWFFWSSLRSQVTHSDFGVSH